MIRVLSLGAGVQSTAMALMAAHGIIGPMHICDIRGWGHLTGRGHGAHAMDEASGIAVQEANSDFIKHAREDIPALLAEIRRLRSRSPAPEPAQSEVESLKDEVIKAADIWRISRSEYLIECEIALSTYAPIEGGTKYRSHAAASAMAASDLVAALQKLNVAEIARAALTGRE